MVSCLLCGHGGRFLHVVHCFIRGSLGGDLLLELGPDELTS